MQAIDVDRARVTMSSKIENTGRIIIQVSDNGPGIPEDEIEKIFIPFFTTKEGGSGIGLSLSRHIMRLHKGAVNVQSRPDEDTVFTLRFWICEKGLTYWKFSGV